jgi:hypothetical protein
MWKQVALRGRPCLFWNYRQQRPCPHQPHTHVVFDYPGLPASLTIYREDPTVSFLLSGNACPGHMLVLLRWAHRADIRWSASPLR